MTSPPVTPPKPAKRRRWLLVALLLVLASGVAWWEWPRGDARFVGNWRTTKSWDSHFSNETIFFFEERVMVVEGYEQPPTMTMPFRWTSPDHVLTLRLDLERLDRLLSHPFADWLEWISDLIRVEHAFEFQFSDDANSLTLRRDGQPVVSLQRIPE